MIREALQALESVHAFRLTEAYTGKKLGLCTDYRSLNVSKVVEVRFRVGEMPEVYVETEGSKKYMDELNKPCEHDTCRCVCHTVTPEDKDIQISHCTPCCQGPCKRCGQNKPFEITDWSKTFNAT